MVRASKLQFWASAGFEHTSHIASADKPIRIDEGADISFITISPDGRWVVTFAHNPAGLVKIWDARDGGSWRFLGVRGDVVPAHTYGPSASA